MFRVSLSIQWTYHLIPLSDLEFKSWFGSEGHSLNQNGPLRERKTNNAAEIQAVTETIKIAKDQNMKAILIHTDSQFLINCVTKWMKGWIKNGWKTAKGEPVKNQMELQELDRAATEGSL